MFKFKRNRNKEQKVIQDAKMFIRGLLPGWFLRLIRRRQVPLDKMLAFRQTHQPISGNASFETIGIVVPCYGHASYLPLTFESIVNQTIIPNRVVFIDDHSPDQTADVLSGLIAEYESANPGKIRFILESNKKNLGQAETLNRAVELCQTDLITILNDDDYIFHDLLETSIAIFKMNPDLALIGGSNISIEGDDDLRERPKLIKDVAPKGLVALRITKPLDALEFEDYCSLNMTHTGSTFARSKAISAGLYWPKPKRIVKFSDRDFQIRVNLLYPVGSTGEVPFCYWRSDSSVDSGLFT